MKLSNIFQNGMVLQQKQDIRIFGKTDVNCLVEVSLKNTRTLIVHKHQVKSDDSGLFLCILPPLKGGYDTYSLTATSCDETEVIDDIVIGELYVTAGQSNMAYPLDYLEDNGKYLKKCDDYIRFMNIEDLTILRPYHPLDNLKSGQWTYTTNQAVLKCSAIGFVFASQLKERLDVPIGLINTAVGGSSIDSWLSHKAIDENEQIKDYLIDEGRFVEEDDYHKMGDLNYTVKAGIYNEKITPIRHLTIGGILWYQGENSVKDFGSAKYYRIALKTLIAQFRNIFRNEHLPIVVCHIALNYYPQGSEFAVPMINEAISLVSQEHQHVYQIPVYDYYPNWLIEDGRDLYNPIHPVTKSFIGLRIANTLYKNEYTHLGGAKPPILSDIQYFKDILVLTFNDVFEGLKTDDDDTIYGFTIASDNHVYHDATAKIISHNQIEVYNEYVKEPKYVTYGFFLYNTICNVKNSEEYPLIPFRNTYDSCDQAKYYAPAKYLYGESLLEYENNFFPQFGGAYHKPCWDSGRLNNQGRVALSLDKQYKTQGNSSIQVSYEILTQGVNYIGVSPIIDYVGHHHHIENFNYLKVDIMSMQKNVKFLGVLIKTQQNDVYLLPVREASYLGVTMAKNEFITYTIDLRKAYRSDTCIIDCSQEMLQSIYEMQLTFQVKENGVLYIDHLRYHL